MAATVTESPSPRSAPPKTDCIRFHPPEGRRTMPMHSKHTIQKLQNVLQERLDHLLKAIQGTDVTSEEERMHGLHEPHARSAPTTCESRSMTSRPFSKRSRRRWANAEPERTQGLQHHRSNCPTTTPACTLGGVHGRRSGSLGRA